MTPTQRAVLRGCLSIAREYASEREPLTAVTTFFYGPGLHSAARALVRRGPLTAHVDTGDGEIERRCYRLTAAGLAMAEENETP